MIKSRSHCFLLTLLMGVFACFTACKSDEAQHREKYWTDENYPKYGLLAMRIIPDSSRDEYICTIQELVTAGRQKAEFVPENSLKYAKEIADQMYVVQTEGLSVYLGQHQRIDKPLCHLDSAELAIFMHLKYGEFGKPDSQEPDTVIVELVNVP